MIGIVIDEYEREISETRDEMGWERYLVFRKGEKSGGALSREEHARSGPASRLPPFRTHSHIRGQIKACMLGTYLDADSDGVLNCILLDRCNF